MRATEKQAWLTCSSNERISKMGVSGYDFLSRLGGFSENIQASEYGFFKVIFHL